MGLSTIIRYSVPVLMLIYPPAIALILLAMFGKHLDHDKNVYIWVTAFTWAASIFDFFKTLPEQVQMLFHLDKAVEFAQTFLPFFHLNLGWIIPGNDRTDHRSLFQKQQKKTAGACLTPAVFSAFTVYRNL